jgi:hypothetical protein
MARTKISEFSATPANNTDIDSINLAEGMAPSLVNDAIRELMAQLKDFQTGAVGDSFNGPIGTTTAAAGAFTTLSASSTLGVTGVSTLTGGAVVQGLTVGKGTGAVATNVALGAGALQSANSGNGNNIAVGYEAGRNNTTGAYNTWVGGLDYSGGLAVGRNNTTGQYNSGFGAGALANNTTASQNTAVGYQAAYTNSTGTSLEAFGYQALFSNSTGQYNSAFGYTALYSNTTGTQNNAFSRGALYANTTGGFNNAFGLSALGANTTGSNNTAMGANALNSNTTASNNTAVGYQAGYSNTTGTRNTLVGQIAGYALTTGGANVVMGDNAFKAATTGENSVAIGTYALAATTTGNFNTAVGAGAGESITTGAKNSILGRYNGNQGGLDIRTASNYIVLSDGDGNPRQIQDGSGNIFWKGSGAGAQTLAGITGGTGDAKGIDNSDGARLLSSRGSTAAREHYIFYNPNGDVGSIDTSGSATSYNTSSDYRLKNTIAPMTDALAKVALLKPCTYKWNVDGSDGEGFIAHELAEVVPQCVTGEKDAVDENGKIKPQGIDVSFLVATLTAAIQELKAEFDAYKLTHP